MQKSDVVQEQNIRLKPVLEAPPLPLRHPEHAAFSSCLHSELVVNLAKLLVPLTGLPQGFGKNKAWFLTTWTMVILPTVFVPAAARSR